MAIHFKLLLVLALFAISASGDSLSIDCGSSGYAYDDNFILWQGDDDLFLKGTSAEMVQAANSISKVMDTLRVFTARNKNCYDLKVGADTQVLVRASFNYGNYDKKSAPPTFDLHFDGNFWTTVETSSKGVVYYEVIYVTKRDNLSVCVAQTKPNQIPFISALEVRSLGSNMYSQVDSTVALFLHNRVAYGATSPRVDDPYDRIWEPAKLGTGQVAVTYDGSYIFDLTDQDNPPQSVLQNAIRSSSTSQPLILDMGFPLVNSQAYINWYFTELTELDTTQTRSFGIFMNNKSIFNPILPSSYNLSEFSVSKFDVPSGAIFALVATTDSDLPPIITAMEVFTISDVLTQGTNINDVQGLDALISSFEVLNDWGGDPCLPKPYSWEWVNCSSDDIPRITAINLNGYGLDGQIPDLSSMDALVSINFQKNNLVGPIPDTLGLLPNLKQLNVADNKLSGPIPSSLTKNNKLDLVWTGNPSLCKSGCQVNDETPGYVPGSSDGNTPVYVTTRRSKKSKTPVIVGTTIPLFLVFWAIVGLVIVLRKRKSAAMSGANKPHGINSEMASDIGEAVMNEITADRTGGQTSNQPQQQG